MGPRPADFDEEIIKQSPTFVKWTDLQPGEKLRYACREFVKGQGEDEERLMRRIMIARRNNIRDHETLKIARKQTTAAATTTMLTGATTTTAISATPPVAASIPTFEVVMPTEAAAVVVPFAKTTAVAADKESTTATTTDATTTTTVTDTTTTTATNIHKTVARSVTAATITRARRPPHSFSDHQVEQEMDVPAVEKTRSYRTWTELVNGSEFVVRCRCLLWCDPLAKRKFTFIIYIYISRCSVPENRYGWLFVLLSMKCVRIRFLQQYHSNNVTL